jgi:hypothetical protein
VNFDKLKKQNEEKGKSRWQQPLLKHSNKNQYFKKPCQIINTNYQRMQMANPTPLNREPKPPCAFVI